LRSIWSGDRNTIERILDTDLVFNVDAFPKDSSPLLAEAVAYGRLEVLALFLSRGANVNLQYGEYSNFALQKAVQPDSLACPLENLPNFEAIVKLLLERGADANAVDARGRNALFSAVTWQADEDRVKGFVKLLLDAGADVNCVDKYGLSVLDWAIRPTFFSIDLVYSSKELIAFLRGLGAKRSSELLTA
jgi:ankyrin repeat protein